MIAEETLYLTEDQQLVPEGDPKARWLFCAKGTTLEADQKAFLDASGAPSSAAAEPATGMKADEAKSKKQKKTA